MSIPREKICGSNSDAGEATPVIEGEFEVLASVRHNITPDELYQYRNEEKKYNSKRGNSTSVLNTEKKNLKDRRQSDKQHLIETRTGDRRRHRHVDISV